MKVAELIDRLMALPKDTDVFIERYHDGLRAMGAKDREIEQIQSVWFASDDDPAIEDIIVLI